MHDDLRIDLLARVARSAARDGQPVDPTRPASILSMAAASYGARPSEDATVPTGFDPLAVALFEAIVEGAYLVAAADGVVDAEERDVRASRAGGVRRVGRRRRISRRWSATSPTSSPRTAWTGASRRSRAPRQEGARAGGPAHRRAARAGERPGQPRRARGAREIAPRCGLEAREVDKALSDVREALRTADASP